VADGGIVLAIEEAVETTEGEDDEMTTTNMIAEVADGTDEAEGTTTMISIEEILHGEKTAVNDGGETTTMTTIDRIEEAEEEETPAAEDQQVARSLLEI